MTLPSPFAYPTTPHARVHGPSGYRDYADFKPFLRDEFAFRCVYCLEREMWYPNRADSFAVDHFTPQVLDPTRETDYDNLVYACVRCNSAKQANLTELDPTRVAFADHFRVAEDGRVEGLFPESRELIRLLRLNSTPALGIRRQVLRILRLKDKYPDDEDIRDSFVAMFGYPDDLPDLARLRPPGGNSRPDGIAASHFERRTRGELPDTY
jgi:hypothetical protein